MNGSVKTKLYFAGSLSAAMLAKIVDPKHTIVIVDRKLVGSGPAARVVSPWLRRFNAVFAVTAGEELKSLRSFSKLAERIHTAVGSEASRDWTVLAIGGGSVGDAAGFFAATYKRGLGLVHIPSTWLAALDSAHGGKNALNLSGAKNQIGTVHMPSDVIVVRSLLESQPPARALEAWGELAKTAILAGPALRQAIGVVRPRKQRRGASAKRPATSAGETLWAALPKAIRFKTAIVAQDPYETKGLRRLLNLGHTFGHVIEAERNLPHGQAVGLGLLFAIDVSVRERRLSLTRAQEMRRWLADVGIIRPPSWRAIPASRAKRLLLSDKKRLGRGTVHFLLIEDWGRVRSAQLTVGKILSAAKASGWIR